MSRERQGRLGFLSYGGVMRLLVMSMAVMGLLISECAAEYPLPSTPLQRHYDCLRSASPSNCAAEYPLPSTPQQQFLQDRHDCLRQAAAGGQSHTYSLKPIVVPPSNKPNAPDPAPNEQNPRIRAAAVQLHYEAQLFQSCMAGRGYKVK